MTTSIDLVRQLDERLRRTSPVDAGLAEVLAAAQAAPGPAEGFSLVQRLLRERIRALEESAVALGNLSKAVTRLRRVFRFTEDGWPTERSRLQALVETAPADAARAWLDYTWQAAADYRLEAIRRLVDDGPLPDDYGFLRDRVRTCVAGLESKDLWLARPLLDEGLTVAGGAPAAQGLRLLVARLALLAGETEVARSVLEKGSGAAALALRAAAARSTGDLDTARRLLSEAEAIDAFDMDVVHEGVRQALGLRMPQEAKEIAQRGVDVRSSLVDIQHEVGKLLDPPAQLWLAVARRAHHESAARLCLEALERATDVAWAGDDYDRALGEVYEIRAAMTEGVGRARYLLEAGDRWISVPDVPAAREDYETALSAFEHTEDRPLWASLVFRRGDCIAVQSSQEPLRDVRPELTQALADLVEAQAVAGAVADEPWSFGVEFDLRNRLSSCLGQPRNEHLWRGFLAALRSGSLQLDQARSWQSIADAAGAMGFTPLALAAAEASFARSAQDDPSTIAVCLTNAYRYDAALARLADDRTAWAESIRGWIRWRQGRFEESARMLSSVTIDPQWSWARNALVSSLVLTARPDLARSTAEQFAAEMPEEPEEFETTLHNARLRLVLGDVPRARERAAAAQAVEVGSDEGEASFLLAQLHLLSGDREKAAALLATALERRRGRPLTEWALVDRPHLCAVAEMHDLPTEGLDDFDAKVRAAQAHDRSSSEVTVDDLDDAGVDPVVTTAARRLAVAVLAVATGDLARAREALSVLPRDLEAERQSLERYVDALETPAPPQLPQEDLPPAAEPPREEHPLRLELPASWFEDYDDPVRQHPIFLRCLPELRARATAEIPPVKVAAVVELEPDRYQVLAGDGGAVLASGRLPAGSRFCAVETLAALPERLRAAAEIQPGGLAAVPEQQFGSQDHLARLVTLDRNEAAVAEVGRVVGHRPQLDSEKVPAQTTAGP